MLTPSKNSATISGDPVRVVAATRPTIDSAITSVGSNRQEEKSDLGGAVPAKTVLVVEDDPQLSDLLSVIVQALGYQVAVAQDGLTAIGMATTMSPALITLDLALPVLDGQSVLDRLAIDERTRGIPVVVLSACARDLRRTTQVVEVMGKPFEVDELICILDRTILS